MIAPRMFSNFEVVGGIVQRMRWIPQGSLWMGSPEDEEDRFGDEGPQHEVTFANGFWMMDTPVRQCLWQAVMGDNPSHFQGPERPVEMVSWDAAQLFISRINEQIPKLDLSLPSEAQWEYACRAGSKAPRYAGELDQIAWYWENSESQTHPVGQKRPNGYGLYDMLGNVWEWCADHWHDNHNGAPTDGSAWVDSGPRRTLRGGCWGSNARLVRSAVRRADSHNYRQSYVGFRCVRKL